MKKKQKQMKLYLNLKNTRSLHENIKWQNQMKLYVFKMEMRLNIIIT